MEPRIGEPLPRADEAHHLADYLVDAYHHEVEIVVPYAPRHG